MAGSKVSVNKTSVIMKANQRISHKAKELQAGRKILALLQVSFWGKCCVFANVPKCEEGRRDMVSQPDMETDAA